MGKKEPRADIEGDVNGQKGQREAEGRTPAAELTPAEELERLKERHLRLAAEFENYKMRAERDMADFKRRATDGVLMGLLEVVDSLDRALEATEEGQEGGLLEGLKAIRTQMGSFLSREGVTVITAEGCAFDPFEMEAILRMPSEDVEEGNVMREIQKGYKGRGYVLRPSKVIVSSGPPRPEAACDEAGEDTAVEVRINNNRK